MSSSIHYEAIKLLAQARHERGTGNTDRAIELLNQIIALGDANRELKHEYAYRQSHAELFHIYESLGQDQDALKYYKRAIQLGMQPKEIDR